MHWSCFIYISAAVVIGLIWGVVLVVVSVLYFRPVKGPSAGVSNHKELMKVKCYETH